MASNPVTGLTEEQYLALDRAAEIRSEFLDGEMFAMSGGTEAHARLQWNLLGEFHAVLRARGCAAYSSDFRVRVSSRMYTYPDVTVVCGERRLADDRKDTLLNPVVIFEILSPSTENYDRGVKFQRYRGIESLKEYILVDQNQVLVEQYIRQGDNAWMLRDYRSLDEELKMDSIGVALAVRLIYDGVELPTV